MNGASGRVDTGAAAPFPAGAGLVKGTATARQRSTGVGRITVRPGDKSRALRKLFQQGAARIRLPGTDHDALEAVLMNTSGGLTGGDRLDWTVDVEEGGRLRVTTAAAEKLYRSHGPEALVRARLLVGADARLDWLPQETIVFDRSALRRRVDVELHRSSTLLMAEAFVLGRHAMGETLTCIALEDQWRVTRQGALLHAEALKLRGDIGTIAPKKGVLHNHGAFATVLYVSPAIREHHIQLATRLQTCCDTLASSRPAPSAVVATSVFDDKLVCRLLAVDGFALRRYLIPCLQILGGDQALPRVWAV